jgi:hypothetical protein
MRAILVLLATAAFVLAPSITPPFRGYEPGMFPVLIARPAIQPAGYAFAIWGVIYTWLAVHAVVGLWHRADAAWERVRLPHFGALALGAVWLAVAGGYPITATVAILVMAGCAVASFLRADEQTDRWLVQAPLALFAGWLTAASMVSTGVVLAGYGWLGDSASAYAMLAVVLAVALTMQGLRPRMPIYSVAVVWAAVGVAVVNWPGNAPVAMAAMGGALVQASFAGWRYGRVAMAAGALRVEVAGRS